MSPDTCRILFIFQSLKALKTVTSILRTPVLGRNIWTLTLLKKSTRYIHTFTTGRLFCFCVRVRVCLFVLSEVSSCHFNVLHLLEEMMIGPLFAALSRWMTGSNRADKHRRPTTRLASPWQWLNWPQIASDREQCQQARAHKSPEWAHKRTHTAPCILKKHFLWKQAWEFGKRGARLHVFTHAQTQRVQNCSSSREQTPSQTHCCHFTCRGMKKTDRLHLHLGSSTEPRAQSSKTKLPWVEGRELSGWGRTRNETTCKMILIEQILLCNKPRTVNRCFSVSFHCCAVCWKAMSETYYSLRFKFHLFYRYNKLILWKPSDNELYFLKITS